MDTRTETWAEAGFSRHRLVATSAYAYDAADRLASLRHARKNNKTIAGYAFTYDAAGRMTSFTTPDGTSNYSFDDTNQLTGADHSYQRDENYSYSGNGNRTNPGYETGADNPCSQNTRPRTKTPAELALVAAAAGNFGRRCDPGYGHLCR